MLKKIEYGMHGLGKKKIKEEWHARCTILLNIVFNYAAATSAKKRFKGKRSSKAELNTWLHIYESSIALKQ